MTYSPLNTAIVITDPQNDFLSPDGATWELVGDSVTENRTVEHLEELIQGAKSSGYQVFVSPHYYYPTDDDWQFRGTLENVMHDINMFARSGSLSLEGFDGSGADWVEPLAKLVADGETIVVSPHKVYGPQTNDLALQLRKRGKSKVLFASDHPAIQMDRCLEEANKLDLRPGILEGFLYDNAARLFFGES